LLVWWLRCLLVEPPPHGLLLSLLWSVQGINLSRYAHFFDVATVDGVPQRVFSNPFAHANRVDNIKEFFGLVPPLNVTRDTLRERLVRITTEVRVCVWGRGVGFGGRSVGFCVWGFGCGVLGGVWWGVVLFGCMRASFACEGGCAGASSPRALAPRCNLSPC
jgi:hypothetical protein